jgi:YgiT-type zinc finger domain-containing protein
MDQTLRICPVCRVGRLKPANVTYMNQYGETVVSAQKIPAWTCDVCGETEFDESALQRMELLLGQSLLPPNRYRPAPARKPAAGATGDAQAPAKPKRAGNRKASTK